MATWLDAQCLSNAANSEDQTLATRRGCEFSRSLRLTEMHELLKASLTLREIASPSEPRVKTERLRDHRSHSFAHLLMTTRSTRDLVETSRHVV